MTKEMDGEDESNDKEQEVKPMVGPSKTLSFCERMKKLFVHCLPLKERMKDHTIKDVDVFCSDLICTRIDKDVMPQVSKKAGTTKAQIKGLERSLK